MSLQYVPLPWKPTIETEEFVFQSGTSIKAFFIEVNLTFITLTIIGAWQVGAGGIAMTAIPGAVTAFINVSAESTISIEAIYTCTLI